MRKYNEDETVTYLQIIIPKHIVPEQLSTLHGETNKHRDITKLIQEYRTKYSYPGLARKIQVVFSRYFFAYLTQDIKVGTVGRCIIDAMTRKYYLPTVILTDINFNADQKWSTR